MSLPIISGMLLDTESISATSQAVTGIIDRTESPKSFRNRLMIDCKGVVVPLGKVLDPWQEEDYLQADRGWTRMVSGKGNGRLWYYFERPKGHDKTSGLAHMAAWAMHSSPRPLNGYAGASTKDQAGLLKREIEKIVGLNPWLRDSLQVNRWEIRNRRTGSLLTILTSDEFSNQGLNPDFIIADELTVWKKRGLWDALMTAAVKKSGRCFVGVISNAGFGKGHSWQWEIREKARTDVENWYFRRLDRPCASWMSEADYRKLEGLVKANEIQRVIYNIWQEDGGQSLRAEDIDRAMAYWDTGLDEFHAMWEPFIGGLDVAVRRHHAAFVIVGVSQRTGRLRLVHCKNWNPADYPNHEIDLVEVHEHVKEMRAKFRMFELCADPHQAILSLQMLRREAVVNPNLAMFIKEVSFSSATECKEMANALVDVFSNDRIEMYPDAMLREDLLRLAVVQRGFVYRIEAPEDPDTGHCDRAIALSMTLPTAIQFAAELHTSPIVPTPEQQMVEHFGVKMQVAKTETSSYNQPGERSWRSV